MTLIISVLTREFALQVSDRQLSVDGRQTLAPAETQANKAITYVCNDGRFLVGFTGLAKLGGFETAWWLMDQLSDLSPPEYSAEVTTNRLQEALTRKFHAFRTLASARNRRLAVMLSGFMSDGRFAYGVISNFNGPDADEPAYATARPEFAMRRYASDTGAQVSWIGREDLIPISAARILLRLASDGHSGDVLMKHTVRTLQEAASSGRARSEVSEECTAVILDGATGSERASYFRRRGESGTTLHGPSTVYATSQFSMAIANPVSNFPYAIEIGPQGVSLGPLTP